MLICKIAVADLTGAWALSTFGFISIAFLPFPFAIMFLGPKLRAMSKDDGDMSNQVMKTQMDAMANKHRKVEA